MDYLKSGLRITWKQLFIVLVLFLYRIGWGITLYQYVKSIIVPLMHRYPAGDLPPAAVRLFLIEGQFQLFKTDLANPYLWTLLGLFAIRMLATPLLSGGLFYALHHQDQPVGTAFFRGMKRMAKPFIVYYALQTALTVLPLIWIYPHLKEAVFLVGNYEQMLLSLAPWVIGWMLYAGLIELMFMYIQFGRVAKYGVVNALLTFFRSLLPVCGLALILALITGAIALTAVGSTLWWAGFAAVLVHQAFYFFQSFFKMWGIAAQYQLWTVKSR
ncbi:hypothetical protein [Paenibacillus turpanensis]|uniref:hypothetical protein n=1 Tax=Paenibacillus turpanensis TaxID=2689078 RepID=UPI00140D3817|nr:hypothetical protein [Paenibacillus turpanensis]